MLDRGWMEGESTAHRLLGHKAARYAAVRDPDGGDRHRGGRGFGGGIHGASLLLPGGRWWLGRRRACSSPRTWASSFWNP